MIEHPCTEISNWAWVKGAWGQTGAWEDVGQCKHEMDMQR